MSPVQIWNLSNNLKWYVTKKIKKGDVFQRKVTIPEGLTSQQTIDILKNTKGIIVNKNIHFIDEGSLFPSTYFYVYDTDINEIINKMSSLK